ncbi:tannase/feruloyl esterase family alpha/beta hydrolase [Ramlibacter sp. WS9]|uniref:tannase/feruloyl esterase family alpha/beta hydrolase n=1 Tax=Ramlibacter sp. WS9 TaxID=1882741 RepID=UPI0011439C62|nr:tannase/feruloyl esterase family alpha/beta hydrolase [Ramlibacter sp. WS9]ROZ74372.1 tannase/feruloyl esterase family alpha/beta hydrolase [Ramlibacter sp. WS9]
MNISWTPARILRRAALPAVAASAMLVGLASCGGSTPAALLACDDSLKTGFQPDSNTSVLLVKAFKKGDPLLLSGTATASTPAAANDLCVVKLNVGPGNPGPAGAPSTSPGIGIEIWLPSRGNWNQRLHVLGGGGWAGGIEGSTTQLAGLPTPFSGPTAAAVIAGVEGAVSATTDTGHAVGTGSFAMKPDGSINTALWTDFSSRAIHEMAVKTKALAAAYYGSAPKYSYWEGFSTGGRQGLKEAQANPADFDGILAGAPANNWSKFITAELYPQIVFQQDLAGAPLTTAQQDLVSNAAINACDVVGGQHLGYIPDPASCHYDATADASVLCASSGGSNSTAACVSTAQARAINKFWYGMTSDGSVQSPAVDNGWGAASSAGGPTGAQRWYGLARGTSLYGSTFAAFGLNGLTSPNGPFPIASDMVALEMQNPAIAAPNFTNATGNGTDGWKTLTYAQLSNAFDLGVSLQSSFGQINTDSADLSAFKARGGKLLQYHGLADELIMPQGSVNYYSRVQSAMGGQDAVSGFYRLFLIPGFGHGTPNGTSNPLATPPIPMPGQLYGVLTDWVEKGIAPETIVLQSLPGASTRSAPVCAYPKKAAFTTGNPFAAASYTCS